jgi:phenylalanyl-tRNA synthetase beta chain
MKVPISWVKDFVEIHLPLEKLAQTLTLAGLEVEEIQYVGLPLPEKADTKVNGMAWDPEKIVVAAVSEVLPHPNADRLVLCKLFDGQQEHIVLTGAPNLYPYKGQGSLDPPLKVPYAKEGARIYDGHQPGQVLTTLKRAKIRGVESYSMICSEKELGISEEHEGVIILDPEAPVGVPLGDYIGDAVFTIQITPNIARDANMLGVAREIAALTGQPLKPPSYEFKAEGDPIEGRASIQITAPELNPRFVLGLIEDITVKPSPYWVQRRLRLAGMRPINNIVDATNYAMLEIGEPLHAFDYDVLVQRAGGKAPTILTRTARPGEHLTTLDGERRELDDFTVLVCDTAGSLSIAGVMGGAESEVNEKTRNILLEGAAWNFINIRRTVTAQHMTSEAAYRFSRGVHPALARRGVGRCLELMRLWGDGRVAEGLVDVYPLPQNDPVAQVSEADVRRILGIHLSAQEIAGLLERLEFQVTLNGNSVRARTPDHRLDIGEDLVGTADLLEEIARMYGYEYVPETRLRDELPSQRNNPSLEKEERLRDVLAGLGLQEIVSYRLTSAEREGRRLPPGVPADDKPYVVLANPLVSDRNVMRHSLLASLFEVLERNTRLRPSMALFEIGPIFIGGEEDDLPDEIQRLGIVMTGPRSASSWQPADESPVDFYDLKGVIEAMLSELRLKDIRFEAWKYPVFHHGKCARVVIGESQAGVFGEVHPQVRQKYDMPPTAVLAAWFDVKSLLENVPELFVAESVPTYPPVLEDLAVVVDEAVPAGQVADLIRQAGGKVVQEVRLFDLYRGEQIGVGKKSLAYSITYQARDRTLTDPDVAGIRNRILRRLEEGLGARLRS